MWEHSACPMWLTEKECAIIIAIAILSIMIIRFVIFIIRTLH